MIVPHNVTIRTCIPTKIKSCMFNVYTSYTHRLDVHGSTSINTHITYPNVRPIYECNVRIHHVYISFSLERVRTHGVCNDFKCVCYVNTLHLSMLSG